MQEHLTAPQTIDLRCTISLCFKPASGEPRTKRYTLVGDDRKHDLAKGVIGIGSVWGKALNGKRLNEIVELCEGEGNVASATIVAIGH